jgi:hypothetical protein
MPKPQAIQPDDMIVSTPRRPLSATRQRGVVPSAELVSLNFKMPPDFVRAFKRAAVDRDMKLNELLISAFQHFVNTSKQ